MEEIIVINVNGGVVDVESNPCNRKIVIRDYDAEMYDEDELVEDSDGNEYKEIEY